jgi:hypothetical protein
VFGLTVTAAFATVALLDPVTVPTKVAVPRSCPNAQEMKANIATTGYAIIFFTCLTLKKQRLGYALGGIVANFNYPAPQFAVKSWTDFSTHPASISPIFRWAV